MNNKTIIITLLSCLATTQTSFSMNLDLGPIQSVQASIDTKDVDTVDYGIINKQTIKAISLPTSGKKIIAITPTVGTYTGQPVKGLFYVLDVSTQLPADAPANLLAALKKAQKDASTSDQIKTVIGLFVQKPNQTNWTSVNQMVSSDTPASLQAENAINLILTGNGKIVAILPAYQKSIKDASASKIGAAPLIAELGN